MTPRKPRTATSQDPQAMPAGYFPAARTREVVYVEEGGEDATPFRAKVRSHLTVAEFESLVWTKSTPVREMWVGLAPFVLEWNVLMRDDTGAVVPAPAPAVGGPEMFVHIPNELFYFLLVSIKHKSVNPVDPKSSTPSDATPDSPSGSGKDG